MKALLTLLWLGCGLTCFSSPNTYTKLCGINQYWANQQDISRDGLRGTAATEREWISLHLSLVEATLRARNTASLSGIQQRHREQCLRDLRRYVQAGRFPLNEEYNYRTPVFIDRHDNFCAVGYLIKESGYEWLSRKIAANTNEAYVAEMHYPELSSWAAEYGFTVDELAWIQPTYPPERYVKPVGKGTNGEVMELYADEAAGKLYVGGLFSTVDDTIPASNIAYVTEAGGVYTWHTMGSGVNGPVYAIASYNNMIFVAGSFTMAGSVPASNVAYWDGSAWHSAGCIYGVVKDLAAFNGNLYAAGRFDICAALSEVNLAHWNGTNWQQHPGVEGTINTLEVKDTMLVLGGAFRYGPDTLNVIRWSENTWFQPFTNGIRNEVNDFFIFRDTMYAACKHTVPGDKHLLLQLKNNAWISNDTSYYYPGGTQSLNTLCAHGDTLMLGGNFYYYPMIGIGINNCANITPGMADPRNALGVDSTINKMVVFKNALIAGGVFRTGIAGPWGTAQVNSITRKGYPKPSGISPVANPGTVLSIFPNPLHPGKALIIKNNFSASHFTLRDINGKLVAAFRLQSPVGNIPLPHLVAGIYIVEVRNEAGKQAIQKVVVE